MSHLQFEALLSAARTSTKVNDFALVPILGLIGLGFFEACGANIADVGEEHGHRVLKVRGKGGKEVLTPLPPAVQRAVADRTEGPILRNLRAQGFRHLACLHLFMRFTRNPCRTRTPRHHRMGVGG